MTESNYKQKYLIYKNKYLNLKKKLSNKSEKSIIESEINPNKFKKNNNKHTTDNDKTNDNCMLNKILNELKIKQDSFLDFQINNLIEYILDLFVKYKVNNTDTLQYSHWVYNQQLLMSSIPPSCKDIKYIIDNNKINMIISLRENDELYQRCSELENKPIFWRFRIPDFGYQDPNDLKALIDNIINFIYLSPNKLMVHCLGGHGRTGSVICSVIAILVILQQSNFVEIMKELYDLYNSTNKDCSLVQSDKIIHNFIIKHKLTNIEMLISEISEKVFLLSQVYVILSLRKYRVTDNINYRENIHAVLVPETPAQNEMVIDVIKLYIREYLINGKFYFEIISTKDCGDPSIKNTNFKNAWLCPSNVAFKTSLGNKNDCDN